MEKLVRDKIPEIIIAEGRQPTTRVLSDDEYVEALDKKLQEEVCEYLIDQTVEELADILEIIYAICKTKGVSRNQLEVVRKSKEDARGAFDARIFLERVE